MADPLCGQSVFAGTPS